MDTNITIYYLLQCIFRSGWGWRRGGYTCKCRDGYYSSSSVDEDHSKHSFNGSLVESAWKLKNQRKGCVKYHLASKLWMHVTCCSPNVSSWKQMWQDEDEEGEEGWSLLKISVRNKIRETETVSTQLEKIKERLKGRREGERAVSSLIPSFDGCFPDHLLKSCH